MTRPSKAEGGVTRPSKSEMMVVGGRVAIGAPTVLDRKYILGQAKQEQITRPVQSQPTSSTRHLFSLLQSPCTPVSSPSLGSLNSPISLFLISAHLARSQTFMLASINIPPPLTLSDIMRSFTPSSGHEGEVEEGQDHAYPEKSCTVSLEPLEQFEIDSMQSRLSELGIGTSREPTLSARERELADTVPNSHLFLISLNLSSSDSPLLLDQTPRNSWPKLRRYATSRNNGTSYCNKPGRRSCGWIWRGTCGPELLKCCSWGDVWVLQFRIRRCVSEVCFYFNI